jgi:hypothetical protein
VGKAPLGSEPTRSEPSPPIQSRVVAEAKNMGVMVKLAAAGQVVAIEGRAGHEDLL